MANETSLILEELKDIKKEIHYIKKYVVDVDRILTVEDVESIKEAEKDLQEGKTKRLI